MIGFLKMMFCVQVLLKNYYYYYFGQSLDYSQSVIIFPFHVKTYENCEMCKANYWNPLEGEERGAPGPSETYSSAFGLLTFSATENLLEDILACSVCRREVISKCTWNSPFQRWFCESVSESWAAFLPFQTIFIITAFRSTYIITDGLSGILFFKGSLLYTQAAVYYRVEE